MISKAQSKFDLNIKKSLFIKIGNPKLNNIDALNVREFNIKFTLKNFTVNVQMMLFFWQIVWKIQI